MTQILILLTMAVNLLIAANKPDVPLSIKTTAISVANYAIEVANKAIADAQKPIISATSPVVPLESSLPTPIPIPVISVSSSPIFSPIPTFNPEPIITPTPVVLNPRFIGLPKISRSYVFGKHWVYDVIVNYMDADAVGYECFDRSDPSTPLLNNRVQKEFGMGGGTAFKQGTTYDCKFELQNIDGDIDNGKLTRLGIYQDYSFTTPAKSIDIE